MQPQESTPAQTKESNRTDLTVGPVFHSITFFALPMLLGNILQQAYNIVDTWVVGQYIGPGALAGVGASFALMIFLTAILLGLCMGSGVVFSMCFGSKDEDALASALGNSFVLVAAVTLFLTVFPMLNVYRIMDWLNIPAEITGLTHAYLYVVFWGIPAVFLYNFFSVYLKSVGNSIMPLVFLGIAAVLNIVLDLLFVITFRLGTSGAAWATIISQYISGIGIAVYVLLTSPIVRRALLHLQPGAAGIRQIAGYSIFTCLQQSVMQLGILSVQGIVNSFGTTVMASFAAAVKIDSFAYMPAQEYGNAFSTFIAQNVGAGKRLRVVQGIKCALATSLVYCGAASVILWFFAEELMLIFVDAGESNIIFEGVRYLHIEGAFYCGIGCLFLFYGLYRALGNPAMSLVLTIISLGTRVFLACVLSPIPEIGVVGIWWAVPIGWFLADAAGLIYLIKRQKTLLA